MWMRLLTVYLWCYAKALNLLFWFVSKWHRKNQLAYVEAMMNAAQIHASIGRAIMMRAIAYAIENKIEIRDDAPPDSAKELVLSSADGSESLPESAEHPPFHDEAGQPLPLSFEPLPPYPIFEAFFSVKYGKYGRCAAVISGKQHVFSCAELYTFLTGIQEMDDAPPALEAFYGSIMTLIVHRHGQTFDPKKVS